VLLPSLPRDQVEADQLPSSHLYGAHRRAAFSAASLCGVWWTAALGQAVGLFLQIIAFQSLSRWFSKVLIFSKSPQLEAQQACFLPQGYLDVAPTPTTSCGPKILTTAAAFAKDYPLSLSPFLLDAREKFPSELAATLEKIKPII
jgi:hypothetical protein